MRICPERMFHMRILVDVMGGDRPPIELVKGALLAAAEYDAKIMIVGNEGEIRKQAEAEGLSLDPVTILHAEDVITMEDRPMSVLREKNQCSMSVGLRALAQGEADALVSAGNTGALLTGATLIVRRMRGIQRAAIGTILPMEKPLLLMDAGANLEVTPEQLAQFAYLGARYMAHLYGLPSPRVGLLNNGTEETKGNKLQIEAFRLLSESEDVNFVGNVEGKAIPYGVCDVLLTDGFTGNIVLKYTEGFGKYLLGLMKGMFRDGLFSRIAAMAIRKKLRAFKRRFDASEHGGAPLLGLAKPVIKAHGNSNARAIKNAIRQAIRVCSADYMAEIAAFAESQEKLKTDKNSSSALTNE